MFPGRMTTWHLQPSATDNSRWLCWFIFRRHLGGRLKKKAENKWKILKITSIYWNIVCASFMGTKHTAIFVICVILCLLSTWESDGIYVTNFGIQTIRNPSSSLPVSPYCRQVAAQCPGPRDLPWWCGLKTLKSLKRSVCLMLRLFKCSNVSSRWHFQCQKPTWLQLQSIAAYCSLQVHTQR